MRMLRFRKSISGKSIPETGRTQVFQTLRIDLSYWNVYNYGIVAASMHEADEEKG